LPVPKDAQGRAAIHYTTVYKVIGINHNAPPRRGHAL
jgi:hypothetical protein